MLAAMGTAARGGEFAGALIAVIVVYRIAVALERRGRSADVLTAVVGLVLIESLLWDQNSVPVGPFHPRLFGQNFRLYDILLPVVVLARARARRSNRPVSVLGAAVAAFCAWYTCCALMGLANGFGAQNVVFQAKFVIYFGGGYALAAGVNPREIVGSRGLGFLCRPLAVYVLVPVFITKEGVPPDAATVIVSLGIIALLVEIASDRPRFSMILACLVLLISPVSSHQRAALLGLVATVGVALLAPLLPTIHGHRLRVTPTEVLLGAFVLVGAVLSYPLLRGQSVTQLSDYPLGSAIARLQNSAGKRQSATDRVHEIHTMLPLIHQHLVLGWGLARPITYGIAGTSSVLTTTSPDEQYLDFLLRCGIVGLAFFGVAMLIALAWAAWVWRVSSFAPVAALAWGAAAAVAGILARASVEAVSEKYRLAIVLGLGVGMIASAYRSVERVSAGAETPVQTAESVPIGV